MSQIGLEWLRKVFRGLSLYFGTLKVLWVVSVRELGAVCSGRAGPLGIEDVRYSTEHLWGTVKLS